MTTAGTPSMISLNGPWLIKPDSADVGVAERWQEADGAGWQSIDVPSGWQTVLGVGGPGVAWYRRVVGVEKGWAGRGRAWIRFDAVATDATVWVNGREVGRHIGNWAPFQFDVKEALGDGGEATIVVRVDQITATPAEWIDGAPVFGGHISKGFHDVLSLQTAGIWDGVRLERSGDVRALPDGVTIIPDTARGVLKVRCELATCPKAASFECVVLDPAGRECERAVHPISPGTSDASFELAVANAKEWSPESPVLYTVRVALVDDAGRDEHAARVGFRTVTTGGPNNERLLLNGRPIFLSGVLDWGHEPRHMTPAPPPEELRQRFALLKSMGFNCVCLCMWYPPAYFFEIADEMGMLLWQEHPIWKSWMGDELIDSYKEQFVKFFRRDASHPSVVLVSGSCEHERFNAKLAQWWWAEARKRLPDRALQIQTAFFAWTDPTKTDLWDEHTYESSGRWVRYLDDLQASLKEKTPKPFIMGESILYTSWPDIRGLEEATERRGDGATEGETEQAGTLPWWFPKGFAQLAKFERELDSRYGAAVVARFKSGGDRYNLMGRKFQMERYRSYPNHAGVVMNHLRDVMPCRCGFQDDLGKWRFTPEQTRPWLGERVLLLETTEHRRGFVGGARAEWQIGVSNFGAAAFDAGVEVSVESGGKSLQKTSVRLQCPVGEVRRTPVSVQLPLVDRPTRATIRAAGGSCENEWTLWLLPRPGATATPGLYRLAAMDFVDADDMYPDFEEHAYSNGWGLKVRTWVCPLPNPAKLMPEAEPWRHGTPLPDDARVVVAHKLTERLVEFMEGGGRVVHLASKTVGSIPSQPASMWGQVPLLVSDASLGAGTDEALLDLLDYDLTRRTVRTIPTGQLGIADLVKPLVRLVWTHDMQERPRMLDSVFAARVGKGLLVASSLDHTEEAGLWLLERLVRFAAGDAPASPRELPAAEVRRWTVEAAQR